MRTKAFLLRHVIHFLRRGFFTLYCIEDDLRQIVKINQSWAYSTGVPLILVSQSYALLPVDGANTRIDFLAFR